MYIYGFMEIISLLIMYANILKNIKTLSVGYLFYFLFHTFAYFIVQHQQFLNSFLNVNALKDSSKKFKQSFGSLIVFIILEEKSCFIGFSLLFFFLFLQKQNNFFQLFRGTLLKIRVQGHFFYIVFIYCLITFTFYVSNYHYDLIQRNTQIISFISSHNS